MKKRVLVAMSGGVDSSVAAALLVKQGYDCVGIHMRFWFDKAGCGDSAGLPQNKCCTKESLKDCREVCAKLGIPFYVINVEKQFKKSVVDYFLEARKAFKTPNPCVECNRNIKFGFLLDKAAEFNASYVATGHYVRILRGKNGGVELLMAKDKAKDQSYFLYRLTSEKLKKILFPIGNLMKSEVYDLARKFKLGGIYEKKESQGLCFFADASPSTFLKRHLPGKYFKSGPIVAAQGNVIGEHKGLLCYTIGQRQGLGIGGIAGEREGEGWYVTGLDFQKNRLVVGRKKDIFKHELECSDLHFISGHAPLSGGHAPKKREDIKVRIRHRGSLTPASLEVRGKKAFLQCKKPIQAVAPGQSAVFYKGVKVLGGGIIK